VGFLTDLIKALTPPGGLPNVEKLQAQLTSPDAKVRQSAIERLGDLPTGQTVRLLADVIQHDEEYGVRRKAMSAFDKIGEKGAKGDKDLVDALIEASANDNPHIRQHAARALERITAR
jgi:HEAT repeat protein